MKQKCYCQCQWDGVLKNGKDIWDAIKRPSTKRTQKTQLENQHNYFKRVMRMSRSQIWIKFGLLHINMGFPGGASGKEPTCQCRRCKRCRFESWVGKIPWRRAWQRTLVFLPGESHGQRSLVGYSPWAHKELVMTEATYHTCTKI